MRAHRFEQGERAFHIGLDERAGAVDAAVDMAFGGEVNHGARPVLREQAVEQRAVADVALHEHMARIAIECTQALAVAGVGECVEVDERLAGLCQPVEYEIGADETGAAGDENHG